MAVAPYTLEQAEEAIADLRAQVDRLGEVHSIADGAVVPNTPDAGSYSAFSAGGQPAYINPAGLALNHSGGQLATVSPVVATAATATNIAQFLIPAGDCVAGAVYKVSTFGFGTTSATQASNSVQWNVTHGGVAGGSETTGTTFLSVSSGLRFFAEATLVCVSPGAGGQFFMGLRVQFTQAGVNIVPNAAGQLSAGIAGVATTAATVDSTADETLRISVAWGGTAGAPSLTAVASWGQRIA